ncbi:MAG TPA: hypothetical protein VK987_00235, partial [Anaerolineae bacterium]|nr:hypothetical protein [Anaerolineae bacterium]
YLWRFVVTIDWPGGSVYLDPVAELLPSVPPSAAVAWDDGYVVGSYVEGLDANAVLTLGADISSLDGRDVTQVPFDDFCTRLLDDPPTMAILGSGAAGSVATQMRWLDAGIGAEPLLLAVSEALPEGLGNAGTDYLWRFVVTIDWPGGSVYLDPVAELLPSVPPSAALAWDEGYVVGSYVEGLDINAGLTLGADINSLDGRDVTQVPFDDFCTRLLDDPPTYQLSIADAAPGAGGGAAPGAALKTVDVVPVEDFFARLGG